VSFPLLRKDDNYSSFNNIINCEIIYIMKCWMIIPALIVAVNADAEAEAIHPPVHAPYGYTPAPPAYGYSPTPAYHPEPAPYTPAAPYHPEPYAPHHPEPYAPHHPEPYSPYAPEPYAPAPYAPAPYAHHPAPHHPAPHHAAPHHAAPHHAAPHHAPHHPKAEPDYGPPTCSKGNPKPWCLEDKEYPAYEIEKAIEYHYDSVQQMYKDVLANTDNSVARLKEIVEETYLCPSETAYIQPLRAVNVNGKWRIIVNAVKAHYETLTQTARIEECTTPGSACPLVPECYETKCLQKSIYHRFLVYDPYDQYLPFAIDSFKLPSACACYNGPYAEAPHKK